jgi:hypothetical protein
MAQPIGVGRLQTSIMTSNLPADTVTFLFTDIEGSTRKAQEDAVLGDAARSPSRHPGVHEGSVRSGGIVAQLELSLNTLGCESANQILMSWRTHGPIK